MSKDDTIILSENPVKIDLLDNWWDVQKRCREDYYYIRSLKIKLDNSMYIIQGDRSVDEINKKDEYIRILSKQASTLMKKFEDHDKHVMTSDLENEVATESYETDTKYFKDYAEIIDKIKKAYILSSDINKLECEILSLIIEELEYTCDELSKGEDNMEMIMLQYRTNKQLGMMLNHSSDEDRIDTIEVDIAKKHIKKEFNNNKMIKIPFTFKVTNYSNSLDKLRKVYKELCELQIKLFNIKRENEKEKISETRNRQQYWFNIIVTIATVFTVIISIIELIVDNK